MLQLTATLTRTLGLPTLITGTEPVCEPAAKPPKAAELKKAAAPTPPEPDDSTSSAEKKEFPATADTVGAKRARSFDLSACSICRNATKTEHCSTCSMPLCADCHLSCADCGEVLCDDNACSITCASNDGCTRGVGCGATLCNSCVWSRWCGGTSELCGECDAKYECPDCDQCASETVEHRAKLGRCIKC